MNRKEIHTSHGAMTPTAWHNTLLENVNTVIGSTGKTLATITTAELHEALGLASVAEAVPVLPSVSINTLEVADALGISRNAAYKLVKSEGFPSFRIGTRLIIPRKKFEQWMDAQTESEMGEPVRKPVQEPEDLS